MTLQELYGEIGGDFDQALKVLRMEKLIDKLIRKFPNNGVVDGLISAGDSMDPTRLFESAHALKGVSANLGLVGISTLASEIAEEYRPGNVRQLTDDEVKDRIQRISDVYKTTLEGIRKYEEG